MTPNIDIKKAIVQRLKNDIIYPVFDYIPQNAKYPFVEISSSYREDSEFGNDHSGGQNCERYNVNIDISIYSDQNNDDELSMILNAVESSLTFTNVSENPLVFENFTNGGQHKESVNFFKNDFSEYRKAVLEIRFIVAKK